MTASGSWRYPKTPLWVLAYRVPRVWLEEKAPPEFPGPAVHPFHHPGHRGGGDGPGLELHQHGGVHVIDAVAQGAEEAGLRVVKGQGADARHGVPDPGPQFVLAVVAGLGGVGGYLLADVVPSDGEGHRLPLELLEHGLDGLNGAHLGAVDVGDHVPRLEPAGPGRGGQPLVGGEVRQPHHQHPLGEEFDSHGLAQGDHIAGGGVLFLRRLGGRGQGEDHHHRSGQQEQRPEEAGCPAGAGTGFGVLQTITSFPGAI